MPAGHRESPQALREVMRECALSVPQHTLTEPVQHLSYLTNFRDEPRAFVDQQVQLYGPAPGGARSRSQTRWRVTGTLQTARSFADRLLQRCSTRWKRPHEGAATWFRAHAVRSGQTLAMPPCVPRRQGRRRASEHGDVLSCAWRMICHIAAEPSPFHCAGYRQSATTEHRLGSMLWAVAGLWLFVVTECLSNNENPRIQYRVRA
jgi:hypothetical protein